MGARGPAPKPATERRRRNKPPTADRELDPVAEDEIEIPPLAFEQTAQQFTRTWWVALWRSPMASQFVETDQLVLTRMAQLVDRVALCTNTPQELSELRQLEDRFGLNPLARRRLGWDVVKPEAKQQAAAADLPSNVTDMSKWQQRL